MGAPVSVRLDDEVRQMLEAEARTKGVGLSAYLRQIAEEEARRVRNRRIREESDRVAAYVASNPEAREFFEFWGTPRAEGL